MKFTSKYNTCNLAFSSETAFTGYQKIHIAEARGTSWMREADVT